MWADILKTVGKAMADQWADNLRQQQALTAQMGYRQFIATLFVGDEQSAMARLRQQVQVLDEAAYAVFLQTVRAMGLEAQQHLAQVEASGGDTAWGTSFEDRMALGMAQIRTGNYSHSQQLIAQARQAVMGMQRVEQLTLQFREQMQAASAAPPPQAATPPPAGAEQEAQINAMIDELIETGQAPAELMAALTRVDDPAVLQRLMQRFKDLGADQLGDRPPDNIADYYRDGDGLYELLWPLAVDLPLPFDELDRPTQFHVLFAECRRRLTEGSAARNAGDLDAADAAFRECLERADQIDVPILKSDAYQGLMTLAEKRGDRAQAQRYLQMSERERKRQSTR